MKKLLQAATLSLVAVLAGCQSSVSEQDHAAATATTETAASVKTYSIEEFMATTSIRGNAISPDNSKILYSSNETGIYNAFEVPVSGGEPKQLTNSTDNSVFVISYFPDGDRILYASDQGGNEITHLYVHNPDGTSRDLTPDAKAKAEFTDWSHDKQSFFYISNKRDERMFDLYEMDLKSLKPKLVYKNDQALDVAAISRDKRYLGLVKSITTNKTDMYLYDTKTKQLKQLTKGQGDVKYYPETFTPDGKKMYYLTDEGREFTSLKSYDLATGKTAEVEQADWDIMYSYFSRNGKYRVTGINKDARTEVKIYEVATGQPVTLPSMPAGDITAVRFSDDERLMSFYVNSSKSPNNLFVYRFDGEKPKQLTDTMNPKIDTDDLVEGQVVRYTSYDGMEIPALLYKPKGIKEGEKRPAVLWIHGGPGGQTRLNYSPLMQYIVNHGYVLLAVNNRGSSGYGKTFFAADDQKHGDVDLKDCIESKKFLTATGYVDPEKIGIMGGSYGGYMVLAGLAFAPDEFAVGVNIFGVSNWLRTLQSIPPWWESFREALYKEMGNPKTDSAALYNKSPLFFAHQIKKPLIVLQGANDPRVLQVESDEIVEAVKKNNVPVEYIVFPDEGHGFVKKENEIKGYSAVLAFLNKHLKGETSGQAGTSGQ
ncbi:S9 family peptidase [Pontibacter sp. JH31]|uniref:S9 family peptidase n=1 Tax=Pontibacter aquaedesilientis TaxID=2766980 RepID=A0ABR7XIQ8_9BACT|nr:S9 family peptidase [Pontibacter aquaedesilientis]MBD1397301.1 S9 family peptidase [Pontibacter aquaedesilientis]